MLATRFMVVKGNFCISFKMKTIVELWQRPRNTMAEAAVDVQHETQAEQRKFNAAKKENSLLPKMP